MKLKELLERALRDLELNMDADVIVFVETKDDGFLLDIHSVCINGDALQINLEKIQE